MYQTQVNQSIIKIIGLLGDFSKKEMAQYQQNLKSGGFVADDFPVKVENNQFVRDENSIKGLKDIFYPDFRDIMFLRPNNEIGNRKLLSRRYVNNKHKFLSFVKENERKEILEIPVVATKTEIYLFPNQIALFSISLELNIKEKTLEDINNVIFLARRFESNTNTQLKWHEWISKNCICDINLRSTNNNIVKADEYSGSKFKVFSVIDCNETENRNALLYDMATASRLHSGLGLGADAPSSVYLEELFSNKISFFNNWDALCLFDSFTCVGKGVILQEWQKLTWADTYFRIYVFRLFFKYNIYRYNSDLHDEPVKLRSRFEVFLNNYHISHISFNFLPNEIFSKTGKALKLDEELEQFQYRINKLSTAILEKKQSKTNMLLQLVTALGAISSVQPVINGLAMIQRQLGWSNALFYTALSMLVLIAGFALLAYLMPELLQKFTKKIMRKK